MSWPNTVSLVTGSVGDALGSSGESADRIYVAVMPVFGEDVHRLLHVVTGTVWDDRAVVQSGAPTLFVQVPHVDQEGFVDGAGNAVTDWYYLVQVITRTGSAKAQWSYLWQPRVADGNTIDLDTLGDGVLVTDPVLVYTPARDAAEAREAAAQALAAAQEAEEWGAAAAGSAGAAAGSAAASAVSAEDAATSVTDALAAVSDAESSMNAAEDAATLASGSASAAAGSASAAAGSATAAGGSAAAAAGSAVGASDSQASASGSASSAASSAAAAAISAAIAAAAASPVAKASDAVRALFTHSDTRPAVFREAAGSLNAWNLAVRIAPARWLTMQLREVTSGSGQMVTQIRDLLHRTAGTVYETDGTSPEITTVGAWTTVTTGSAHGGSTVYAKLATASKRYVTVAGDILATFQVAIGSNGGYSRIVIDGDDTRATGGVTVQSEMDAGRITDATRVAQGWSVNTRLINHYAAGALTYNNFVTAVDDLDGAPGHTIDFVPTGIKQAASSDTRAYIDTFTIGRDVTGAQFAAATSRPVIKTLFNGSSVDNYAVHPSPFDDASGWVGNSHGWDQQTSFNVYVDGKQKVANGAAYTSGGLAEGAGAAGDTVTAVRKSNWLNPANPAQVTATVTEIYTVSPRGITLERNIVSPYQLTFAAESYSAMLALNASFSEARNVALPAKVSATANDQSFKGNGRGDAMIVWEPGGRTAVAMFVDDPAATVRNYPGGSALTFQDRTDGINKVYALFADATAPLVVPAGTLLRWTSTYSSAVVGDPEALFAAT